MREREKQRQKGFDLDSKAMRNAQFFLENNTIILSKEYNQSNKKPNV